MLQRCNELLLHLFSDSTPTDSAYAACVTLEIFWEVRWCNVSCFSVVAHFKRGNLYMLSKPLPILVYDYPFGRGLHYIVGPFKSLYSVWHFANLRHGFPLSWEWLNTMCQRFNALLRDAMIKQCVNRFDLSLCNATLKHCTINQSDLWLQRTSDSTMHCIHGFTSHSLSCALNCHDRQFPVPRIRDTMHPC